MIRNLGAKAEYGVQRRSERAWILCGTVGWDEHSEPQHIGTVALGFAALTPTYGSA
jgi:hypothetical protein